MIDLFVLIGLFLNLLGAVLIALSGGRVAAVLTCSGVLDTDVAPRNRQLAVVGWTLMIVGYAFQLAVAAGFSIRVRPVKALWVPLAQSVVLLFGFLGTVVVGQMRLSFRAFVRSSIYDPGIGRQGVDVSAGPALPTWWRVGWGLLSGALMAQLVIIWVTWLDGSI